MSSRVCGQSRPGASEFDRLNDQAKDLRATELARVVRTMAARLTRFTRDGIDPRLYADKVNPPRRYSSAYF